MIAAKAGNIKIMQGAIVSELKPTKLIQGVLVLSTPIQNEKLRDKLGYFKSSIALEPGSEIIREHVYQKCHGVLTRRRSKRSLFDLGDIFLKNVVGTATMKDIEKLKQETGLRLATQEIKLKHTEKFLNATQKNLELITDTLGNISHVVENMQHRWKITLSLWQIESLCQELDDIKQHFWNSVFDVRMLDESAMYEIIQTYTRDWKLSPISEPGTHDFETTIHTRLITVDGIDYGVIKIPFFGRLEFETYKIQPLPMYTSNECVAIEITPHDASEAQCKIS